MLSNAPRASSLLDIGCSSGATTLVCAEALGAERVAGIDIIDPEEARRRGVEAIRFDLDGRQPLPYETGSFDAATCLETLEHVQDPDFVLQEMARVVRPGGTVLVDVPRLDSLMNILLLALGFQPPGVECSIRRRYGAINEGSILTGHVSYFTRRAMEEMLAHHRLSVRRFCQVSQGSNWVALQKQLGRPVPLLPRLAWRIYDLVPFKKDYLIYLAEAPPDGG